jgi:hypothetical protein
MTSATESGGGTPTPGHSGVERRRLRVMRDRRAAPDLVARFRVRLYQNMIRGGAAGSIRDQETRPATLCPGVGACFTRDDALGAGSSVIIWRGSLAAIQTCIRSALPPAARAACPI